MKKTFLLFLILPYFIQAQTIAFETQFKENYRGYSAMLSVDNKIIAMVQDEDCDDFFLTTNNGTIEWEADCTWNYMPHKRYWGIIYFNKIVDGDTVIFHQKSLLIRPWRFIPTLGSNIPEKNKTIYLTKEELQSVYLGMESINTGLSARAPIVNFEVEIIYKNELLYHKIFTKNSRENRDEYAKQFEQLEKGSIILFTNIKYKYPSATDTPFIFDSYDVRIQVK